MNIMQSQHTVFIGVSSGIAAYKIIDLIKILKLREVDVFVIMTEHAREMISYKEFEEVSGQKVYTTLYPEDFDYQEVLEKKEVEHIKLADSASLLVIAPATANTIGKIAGGIADDFLTTILLAVTCPVLICPSMNVNMWHNPIVAENLEKLKKRGFYIHPPDKGQLACGYEGVGRLAQPQKIAEEIFKLLDKKTQLNGKKIIVTAGATSEPIDAVRVITNRASGKMGKALAEACYLRGAEVLLLKSATAVETISRQDTSRVAGRSGNVGHDSLDGGGITNARSLKIEIFETFEDLEELIKKHIKNFDVLFHTAAVSDFIPEKKLDTKLDSGKSYSLKLKPAAKILHKIKKWNPEIKLIGFKAVYKLSEKELIKEGVDKLKVSKSDYIIVNDVGKEGIGFGVDTNEVYIISKKGFLAKISKNTKIEVAKKIIDALSI